MFEGVQVAVEGEGWMNIFCIFESGGCVQRKGCEG